MGTEDIWLIALGGFGSLISNICYMAGGTEGFGKWWRRFLGSFILSLSASLIALYLNSWSWKYLLMYPALAVGMSLGYGGDKQLTKILKRSLFAFGVLTACFIGAWICGFSVSSLIVLGLAIITGLTSVVLGVFNPFKNAPLEQFIISQVLTLYVPWWAFIS